MSYFSDPVSRLFDLTKENKKLKAENERLREAISSLTDRGPDDLSKALADGRVTGDGHGNISIAQAGGEVKDEN